MSTLAAAWRRNLRWYPGDWIWPVLGLLLVAAAGTAIALGARHERRASSPTLLTQSSLAQQGSTAPRPTTRTVATQTAPASTPQPTISTGTLPLAPGSPSTTVATTPPPTVTAPPAAGGVAAWPGGRSGFTDILESLPESSGRGAAAAQARVARRRGMRHVGVLLSSRFSTLRSGYWVVFAGIYRSETAASAALSTAHARGYAGAYPARVAPRRG